MPYCGTPAPTQDEVLVVAQAVEAVRLHRERRFGELREMLTRLPNLVDVAGLLAGFVEDVHLDSGCPRDQWCTCGKVHSNVTSWLHSRIALTTNGLMPGEEYACDREGCEYAVVLGFNHVLFKNEPGGRRYYCGVTCCVDPDGVLPGHLSE